MIYNRIGTEHREKAAVGNRLLLPARVKYPAAFAAGDLIAEAV